MNIGNLLHFPEQAHILVSGMECMPRNKHFNSDFFFDNLRIRRIRDEIVGIVIASPVSAASGEARTGHGGTEQKPQQFCDFFQGFYLLTLIFSMLLKSALYAADHYALDKIPL